MKTNLSETEILTVKLAIITAIATNPQPIKKSQLLALLHSVATPSIVDRVITILLRATPPVLRSEKIEGRLYFYINHVQGQLPANHL